MSAVNGLKWGVSLGTWRGHEVTFKPEIGKFESDSAGLVCDSLSQIKREIDKQEKIEYVPIQALFTGGANNWSRGEFNFGGSYTIRKPAAKKNSMGREVKDPYVWAVNESKSLVKIAASSFVLDTPNNKRKLDEAKSLFKNSRDLQKQANELIASIETIPMPEPREAE